MESLGLSRIIFIIYEVKLRDIIDLKLIFIARINLQTAIRCGRETSRSQQLLIVRGTLCIYSSLPEKASPVKIFGSIPLLSREDYKNPFHLSAWNIMGSPFREEIYNNKAGPDDLCLINHGTLCKDESFACMYVCVCLCIEEDNILTIDVK